MKIKMDKIIGRESNNRDGSIYLNEIKDENINAMNDLLLSKLLN